MIVRELSTLLDFKVDERGAREFEDRVQRLRNFAIGAATALAALGAAATAAISAAGDEMTSNLNKLERALGSAERAQDIYEKLYQTVRQTGANLSETTTAFLSYNLALGKNNRTAEDTVRLVGGLQAAMSSLGLSTQQVSSVTLQLGQALGKGVLNGDELVSLREAMPQLVEALRKALNMTDEEFAKAAEKGELTAQRLIGPLLEFADEARLRIAGLPTTMSRAAQSLRTTWQRFLADLDRQLGLSQAIARNLERLSKWLEDLRSYIPNLGAIIQRLGGMDSILQVIAISIGIATAALAAFNAGLLVTIVRSILAYAALALPWVLAAAAVGTLAALVQDFVMWVRGNTEGTMFGSWLGDFPAVAQRVVDAFNSVRDAVGAAVEKMRPQVEWLTDVARGPLLAAWEALPKFFGGMWGLVTDIFTAAWNTIRPIVEAITGAAGIIMRMLEGSGARRQDEPPRPRVGGLNGATQRLMSFGDMGSDLSGRMSAPANGNSMNQTINQNVTVNATGNSAAQVAAGAQAGATRALDDARNSWDEGARRLRMANPAVEGAAR